MTACPTCEGAGKILDGYRCPTCKGSGESNYLDVFQTAVGDLAIIFNGGVVYVPQIGLDGTE